MKHLMSRNFPFASCFYDINVHEKCNTINLTVNICAPPPSVYYFQIVGFSVTFINLFSPSLLLTHRQYVSNQPFFVVYSLICFFVQTHAGIVLIQPEALLLVRECVCLVSEVIYCSVILWLCLPITNLYFPLIYITNSLMERIYRVHGSLHISDNTSKWQEMGTFF